MNFQNKNIGPTPEKLPAGPAQQDNFGGGADFAGNMANGPQLGQTPLTDTQGLTGPGAKRAFPPQPPPQMGSGGGNMSIPPQSSGALANKPGFDMGFKKPAPQGIMTGSFARPRTLPADNVAPQRTRPDDSGI